MREGAAVPRVSILGMGNVLLGDNGFGPFTVELFRCEYECGPEVEIADLGTPGLDLSPYLYGREWVILVDALIAEGNPGTVRACPVSEFLGSRARLRLTDHDAGLQESLAQLRLEGRAPSEVIVIGVIPEACVYGKGISQSVAAAASPAVDHICHLLLERGFDCRRRSHALQPRIWCCLADSI
jgi:hydrogenase maturation protease